MFSHVPGFFSLGHGATKSKSENARNVAILGKSRNFALFYSVSQYDYFRRNFFELKGTALFVSHFTSENSFQKYLSMARGRLFKVEISLFRSVGLSAAKKIKEA